MSEKLKPYEDKLHPGNSSVYHTGKKCIEGCGRPAGTRWSPFWCQECNARRINEIDLRLNKIAKDFGIRIQDNENN